MICDAMAEASETSVEETLAWEAEQRPRAALLALIAGNFTLLGGIVASLLFRDFPAVSILDGIRDAAGLPLTVGDGLRTSQLFFYDDKVVPLIAVAVVLAIGSAAMAGVLGYLFRATQARSANLPRIALFGAIGGPVILAVSELVLQVAISLKAHSFVVDKDYSTAAAHDALQGGAVLAAQVLRQIGVLLLAFSFVLISLNAMRVGLLTRFMGILGMIVGALFIIPLGSNLPIVQCFWLVAIGFLIFGRWPNGRPPAWETGRPEPWPTQQELREQRELAAAAAGGGGGRGRSAGDDVIEADAQAVPGDGLPGTPARRPEGVGHPASKKRKTRKRR
ncbi:MAG: hypothetical protein JWN65_522 [Solirubrobacterales bacterium]|nr:hypothetical protein [Solirubrobacterales bacterium]